MKSLLEYLILEGSSTYKLGEDIKKIELRGAPTKALKTLMDAKGITKLKLTDKDTKKTLAEEKPQKLLGDLKISASGDFLDVIKSAVSAGTDFSSLFSTGTVKAAKVDDKKAAQVDLQPVWKTLAGTAGSSARFIHFWINSIMIAAKKGTKELGITSDGKTLIIWEK